MSDMKDLCLNLAKADSENDVVQILKKWGYWDNQEVWRYYGDNENNFAVIGNQQNAPDSALVEKLVNSVDAVLMRECLRMGIDPEGSQAPASIEEALEQFFNIKNGMLTNLHPNERRDLAGNILLVATGTKQNQVTQSLIKEKAKHHGKCQKLFYHWQDPINSESHLFRANLIWEEQGLSNFAVSIIFTLYSRFYSNKYE